MSGFHDRLSKLEETFGGSSPRFRDAVRRGLQLGSWMHELSRLPPDNARRLAGEILAGLPDDDEQLMKFLASVPSDWQPALPPGAIPASPEEMSGSPLPPAPLAGNN